MAKQLSEREVAGVKLLELEVAEDEIAVLTAGLTTLLTMLDDRDIEAKSDASYRKS